MAIVARQKSGAISDGARQRRASLQQYPTLDTWRNPLTRGVARHFAHQAWLKTLEEIDFEYRLTDMDIAGVPCVQYETGAAKATDPIILYVHGGALVAGSPRVNASMILPACHLTSLNAIGVDYTLLPEGRYPAPLDEVDAVYKALIERDEKRRVIIFGDSIGGTIVLANLMRWRDEKTPLPAGAIFASPVIDGAGASDTLTTLDGRDPLFNAHGRKNSQKLFRYYAPGESLLDPKISPIYGDFHGLPPMLVHAGTREVFLGDAARLSEAARRAGVPVSLRVFDGLFHLFHMHWGMEEAKHAHDDIAAFIKAQI